MVAGATVAALDAHDLGGGDQQRLPTVIQGSWQTLQKPACVGTFDRVEAPTGPVAEEISQAFAIVCELARAPDTIAAFMQRLAREGRCLGHSKRCGWGCSDGCAGHRCTTV